jgi:hypothetical protein
MRSPLNNEKRRGKFVCAGCGSPLFSSEVGDEPTTAHQRLCGCVRLLTRAGTQAASSGRDMHS